MSSKAESGSLKPCLMSVVCCRWKMRRSCANRAKDTDCCVTSAFPCAWLSRMRPCKEEMGEEEDEDEDEYGEEEEEEEEDTKCVMRTLDTPLCKKRQMPEE